MPETCLRPSGLSTPLEVATTGATNKARQSEAKHWRSSNFFHQRRHQIPAASNGSRIPDGQQKFATFFYPKIKLQIVGRALERQVCALKWRQISSNDMANCLSAPASLLCPNRSRANLGQASPSRAWGGRKSCTGQVANFHLFHRRGGQLSGLRSANCPPAHPPGRPAARLLAPQLARSFACVRSK